MGTNKNWLAQERGAITRDPKHTFAYSYEGGDGIFAANMRDIRFWLDDKELDHRAVHTAFQDKGEIWLFHRNARGFIEAVDGQLYYTEKGNVRIEGEVTGCTSCQLNERKNKRWWENVNDTDRSW